MTTSNQNKQINILSLDDLETTSRDVRDMKLKENIPLDNEINSNTFEISILFNSRVKLDQSTIKRGGFGVFATDEIKKNSVVTFYPPHYVIYMDKREDANRIESIKISDETKKKPFSQKLLKEYRYDVTKDISICGNNDLVESKSLLGHMINDSEVYNDDLDPDEYLEKSNKKSNVKFVNVNNANVTIVVIATRDIKKGEELFVTYGIDVWLNIDQEKKIMLEKKTFVGISDKDVNELVKFDKVYIEAFKTFEPEGRDIVRFYVDKKQIGFALMGATCVDFFNLDMYDKTEPALVSARELYPQPKENVEPFDDPWTLCYFYVIPEFRNKGIATRMVKSLKKKYDFVCKDDGKFSKKTLESAGCIPMCPFLGDTMFRSRI